MSWQKIELNMIPDTKVLPVVHASQYDSNRSISFQMFTGEDEWTIPEGLTIELHCRKVDDNIVTLAPLSVDGSVITFITTEQLTACSGQNKCELSFINSDDLVIGSLNFILDVEPDPLAGGVTSETEIDNLTQQIEDIATEVIGENYYDKTEVDALLNDKADVSDLPDMSQYYTKTATNTLLNAKADAATTYTKSETDSLLASKANTADLATVATTGDYDDLLNKPVLPDMTQYYTKAEVDAIVDDIFPTLTASGDIATFITALNKPLVSVTADPLATEIIRCGKNLCYSENSDLFPTGDNLPIEVNAATHTAYVRCVPNTTVYFKKVNATNRTYFYGCNDVPAVDVIVHALSYTEISTNVYSVNSGAYTYIALYYSNESTENIMACIDQDYTSTYEAYNGTTVPVADATTITTLTGVNNVFPDAGSVTVQYKYMSI